MMTTYTNKDLVLSCDGWEEFGGNIYSDNHHVNVDDRGNMRLVNTVDNSDFDADQASAEFVQSFGLDTTKAECDQFVSDYVDAWMDAARNVYAPGKPLLRLHEAYPELLRAGHPAPLFVRVLI